MTARTIASQLIENDEDFNVSGEIERLTTTQHPNIEIESEGNHWNVYKKLNAATRYASRNTPMGTDGYHAFIGEITYDDMAEMPTETMTPEQIEYWNTHRWMSSAGFRDSERQMCKSFEEAVNWIIAVNVAKTTPVREALDPDDPELYVKPEQFTEQPNYEKIESDLRIMLRPYYDEVRVNRRPHKFARVFKGLRDYYKWTIHCNRAEALKLPNSQFGPVDWRQQATSWFHDWAERSGIRLKEFEIYGRLRKDPTFQFTTWRLPPPGIGIGTGQPIKESDDNLSPEQIMNDLLPKVDWQKDLENALWGFHPTGVTYTVVAAPNLAFVLANCYFPPEKDNFAPRLRDFVVQWLTEHRILVVKLSKLYTFRHQGASDSERKHLLNYPRWTAGVSVNSDWPSDVSAYDSATVEVRKP